jgi:mannose-6-phosphate isomerase-like protein (cupin superfamily)
MCLDLKSSIKRVPLRVAKGSAAETHKHKIEAWEIEDWRGKLWRGAVGVISIPSNDSTFITMMKRE